VRRNRLQPGWGDAQHVQTSYRCTGNVVNLHRVQIIAAHQWFPRRKLHHASLYPPDPVRQRNDRTPQATTHTTQSRCQLNQFAQRENLWTTRLNNHQLKLVGLGYGLEVPIRVA
jgi:hypothetical protein